MPFPFQKHRLLIMASTFVASTAFLIAARPVPPAFPWTTALRTETNQVVHLARGKRATIIMAMASWCHFCAYEDRWVLPVVIHTPGVAIDIVDVSPFRGIAQPGPKAPAFSGIDGVTHPASVRQMEATMRRYRQRYHLPPSIHVLIAPSAVQKTWHVPGFPDFWFANAKGHVTQHIQHALTLPLMRTALQHALRTNPAHRTF